MLKKAIYSVTAILLLGAACLNYSCSSDYNEPQPVSNTAQEQAKDEILSVFIEFNKTLTPTPQSRVPKLDNLYDIVRADAKGAKNGSKLGGLIGSLFGPEGRTVGRIIGGTIVGSAA